MGFEYGMTGSPLYTISERQELILVGIFNAYCRKNCQLIEASNLTERKNLDLIEKWR